MTRREMLRDCLLAGAGLAIEASLGGCGARNRGGKTGVPRGWHEVSHYEKLPGNRVRCGICWRACEVGPGERGQCGNKENRDGVYYSLVYGQVAALNVDPIEKKPFFHFLPGTAALSFGTAGCNMHCRNCQNWEISQRTPEQVHSLPYSPEALVSMARKQSCASLAYTYNEPTVFYDFMRDTARLAREHGLRSVMVSNGTLRRQPMLELAPVLDAVKVDVKSGTNDFYKQYCDGVLAPVQETIKRVHGLGKWLEVVFLVIPGLTDGRDNIAQACDWLLSAAGPDTPLHFSRFHPEYRLKDIPATPYETLARCHEQARQAGLKYVYVGNVAEDEYQQTRCPGCGRTVIGRSGFEITAIHLDDGRCSYCHQPIPGVWA